ncbi:MAG: HIT family protein [Gammaproteobacteria bacterium]|nr:MAG: HIT family protein [Gammaproteobacteria bacterium]
MCSSEFVLDSVLEQDSIYIGRFELCQLRIINKDAWLWFLLVPVRNNVTEILELSVTDRYYLMDEINAASKLLDFFGSCDKINIGALGNIVKQLHVHVIARKEGDAGWPGPVWGVDAGNPYQPQALQDIVDRIKVCISQDPSIHLEINQDSDQ